MREFCRQDSFDLAINLFTSFGYFETAEDNRRVLQHIYSSLKPGGIFAFDHLGKELLASRFRPTLAEELPDGKVLIHRVAVIDDWSKVECEWILVENG